VTPNLPDAICLIAEHAVSPFFKPLINGNVAD